MSLTPNLPSAVGTPSMPSLAGLVPLDVSQGLGGVSVQGPGPDKFALASLPTDVTPGFSSDLPGVAKTGPADQSSPDSPAPGTPGAAKVEAPKPGGTVHDPAAGQKPVVAASAAPVKADTSAIAAPSLGQPSAAEEPESRSGGFRTGGSSASSGSSGSMMEALLGAMMGDSSALKKMMGGSGGSVGQSFRGRGNFRRGGYFPPVKDPETTAAVTEQAARGVDGVESDGKGGVRHINPVVTAGNAYVTSNFNPGRVHPILGYSKPHAGLDISTPRDGSDHAPRIVASASGVVTGVKREQDGGGYGNYIEITHADGSTTRYAHLARMNVEKGARVKQGQQIGVMGTTGLSTGVHLHYEQRDAQGNPRNPLVNGRTLTAGMHLRPNTFDSIAEDARRAKEERDGKALAAQPQETSPAVKTDVLAACTGGSCCAHCAAITAAETGSGSDIVLGAARDAAPAAPAKPAIVPAAKEGVDAAGKKLADSGTSTTGDHEKQAPAATPDVYAAAAKRTSGRGAA